MTAIDSIPPTPRQLEIVDAIRRLTAANGYAPSLRELGNALGISSTNGVDTHLIALERKGLITRLPNKTRTIRIVEPPGELETLRALVQQMGPLLVSARKVLASIPRDDPPDEAEIELLEGIDDVVSAMEAAGVAPC